MILKAAYKEVFVRAVFKSMELSLCFISLDDVIIQSLEDRLLNSSQGEFLFT